jgi:hypothetical protein
MEHCPISRIIKTPKIGLGTPGSASNEDCDTLNVLTFLSRNNHVFTGPLLPIPENGQPQSLFPVNKSDGQSTNPETGALIRRPGGRQNERLVARVRLTITSPGRRDGPTDRGEELDRRMLVFDPEKRISRTPSW